jgi:hypothetical protein
LAINGGTITNAGTISGANGGLAGVSDLSNGAAGAGGAGIIGSGLVISNSNAITGGMSGDGVTQNYAIVFTGGANSLGSTGTISGGINVQGGAFAPALSTSAIGTPLSFGGPITFASGTQYVVRVSPSAADNLTASAVGTLTGATVNAQFSSGSYLSKQYTILTATGGLGGTTFSGLTNTSLPSGFTDSLSYDTTNGIVFLDLTATLGAVGTVGTTGLNQNQGNVANGLNNFFNGGGSLPPNFITVFGLTGSSLANALTALDGEAATDAEKGAFTLMNQFLGLMLDPFVDGRFGTSGGPIGFAPDQQASFARHRARLRVGAQGATAFVRSALDCMGLCLRCLKHDQWQCGHRLQQCHRNRLWLCGRHGLSRYAELALRLRARRRRHQLEFGARAGHRAQ